jgi:hypothetical protein
VAGELFVLREQAPDAWNELVQILEQLTVRIDCPPERFWLISGSDIDLVKDFVGVVDVQLTLGRGVLAGLVGGRLTLVDALDSGQLDATGKVDDVARVFEAITACIASLVRLSASFAPWRTFRAAQSS